jgi:hypothetical protein
MDSDAGADPKRVNIIFAEGTGSFVVLLEIAKTQALFGKRGIEVRALPTRGAAVPRLSDEAPLGLIGAPAALLQVADGADLKLIATLSTTKASAHGAIHFIGSSCTKWADRWEAVAHILRRGSRDLDRDERGGAARR